MTTTLPERTIRQRKRAALIATIIGGILGFMGLAAGLYIGVIRPALAAGNTLHLPRSLLIATGILMLLGVLWIAWLIGARRRAKRETAHDTW